MNIKIGTRGSALALAQSEQVKDMLKQAYPQHEITLNIITTKGDRIQHIALDQMKDKGIFVKEIEQQLLDGTIDLAVHSMKDMPSVLDERLCFTKILLREDARDVLILREADSLAALPLHARIATGSKRRKYQLLALRPDLEIVGIRGNIDTRLRKLEEEQLDGIVLALAGLQRLSIQPKHMQILPVTDMVPAVAQGALAIEVHKERHDVIAMINALCKEQLDEEVMLERTFLKRMDGGCHTPIGARCILNQDTCTLYTVYGTEDGSALWKKTLKGKREDGMRLVEEACEAYNHKMEEIA